MLDEAEIEDEKDATTYTHEQVMKKMRKIIYDAKQKV